MKLNYQLINVILFNTNLTKLNQNHLQLIMVKQKNL